MSHAPFLSVPASHGLVNRRNVRGKDMAHHVPHNIPPSLGGTMLETYQTPPVALLLDYPALIHLAFFIEAILYHHELVTLLIDLIDLFHNSQVF